MSNQEEIWKDVIGYDGLYQVSNFGRVLGKERKVRSKNNSIKTIASKPLKISSYDIGYKYVTLSKNGKRVKHKLHRLVALSFIPNPNNKPEVNHIDGVKSNCCYSNLEWVTSSENQIHAYKTGLQISKNYLRVGVLNSNSKKVLKLSSKGVILCEYECARMAANDNNVSSSSISEACRIGIKVKGFIWKYK